MSAEASATFPCFGGHCGVWVTGDGPRGTARDAVALAELSLRGWHGRFTRFEAASELSRLNADRREAVPASPLMLRLAQAVGDAARRTGGLVDATMVGAIEAAGYRGELPPSVPLALALQLAPARRPAGPDPASRWRELAVDPDAGVVRRPPGLRIDSGGLAKGLFADVLAEQLAPHETFAVDCAGDVRVGGAADAPRPVLVASPFGGSVLHRWEIADGAAATSGIGRRSWIDARGRVAHHLLDPATGRPAYTGIVQATALAPTAVEAEERAKLALLRGPAGAAGALPDGGVVVYDDGSHEVLPGPAAQRTSPGSVTIPACAASSSPQSSSR